jgi:hypothetical protein
MPSSTMIGRTAGNLHALAANPIALAPPFNLDQFGGADCLESRE